MQIVSKEKDLRHYLRTAVEIDEDKPVLVDRYISGKELEVDAICDGTDVFIPGIMELVGNSFGRLYQRLSDFQRLAKGTGYHQGLYEKIGTRHRY